MSDRDQQLADAGLRELEVSITFTLPAGVPQRHDDRLAMALVAVASDMDHVIEAGVRQLTIPTDDLLFLHNEARTAADVMLGIDNGGTWGSFTCTEIEALAGIFRAAGREDAADFIISEHAESDEGDDMHTKEEPDD